MGRKPIGQQAMTPAQRQQRRRAKLKQALIKCGASIDKAERRKRRLAKIGMQAIPAPPGITYWREITLSTPDGERRVWAPITQPAPGVALLELNDVEIASLIGVLENEQDRRAGKRPRMGDAEKIAFDLMQASRPPHYKSKLDMFAREPRAGWDIYGSEICIGLGVM